MPKKNYAKKSQDVDEIQSIIGWKPPVFHQASECYVSVSAFDPSIGKMRIKKFMLGFIKGKRRQREYGAQLSKRLYKKLLEGWNPWIEVSKPEEYHRFDDVCSQYITYLKKLCKDGGIRKGSVDNYLGKLSFMRKWMQNGKIDVVYIYQFDKNVISKFLDYVFVERGDSIRTRNNYIGWLKSFSSYLLARGYVQKDPTEGIEKSKKAGPKGRSTIPDAILAQIRAYLEENNKFFLLACYLLHYLFIRPQEMVYIKIKDLSREKRTLTLDGTHTKNGHDAVVTIPCHVLDLMEELNIFSFQPDCYLFSKRFRPGKCQIKTAQLAYFWKTRIQGKLGFSNKYKFYSLKDTGITNMIKNNTDLLSVRDQARHSSVEITNMYTPISGSRANINIVNYKGVF